MTSILHRRNIETETALLMIKYKLLPNPLWYTMCSLVRGKTDVQAPIWSLKKKKERNTTDSLASLWKDKWSSKTSWEKCVLYFYLTSIITNIHRNQLLVCIYTYRYFSLDIISKDAVYVDLMFCLTNEEKTRLVQNKASGYHTI